MKNMWCLFVVQHLKGLKGLSNDAVVSGFGADHKSAMVIYVVQKGSRSIFERKECWNA